MVTKTIDIPGKCLDINKLQNTDWKQVHVTQRIIVVDGVTYSLKSNLCSKMKITDSTKVYDPLEDDIAESFVEA